MKCNCKIREYDEYITEQQELYKSPHFDAKVEGGKEWQIYIDYVLELVGLPTGGYWLEFGVYNGRTINYLAEKTKQTIHGFDTFTGLPEDWGNLKKGHFSQNGGLPKVKDNVELHKGLFNNTLANFINREKDSKNTNMCEFIHIDSDLYSSCKTILTLLKDWIVPGTVIALDDFHNWKCCIEGEMRALIESGLNYKYIAHTSHVQGAIKVL